jgi:tRNA (guanine26-N2/guanine27-N2)-dimethyltransferase
MEIITEQSAKIFADTGKTISKQLEVFYNPIMKLNRDMSILLLNALDKTDMQIADVMAGSGIRSLRFIQELKPGKIHTLYVNDYDAKFIETMHTNFSLNSIDPKSHDDDVQVVVSDDDANLFLLNSKGFDYIDIDPFGTPNPYLDAAVKRIARDGILAVTATDTAALTGTYTTVSRRKYWAESMKNELMHELGLRILIRKVQLIGAQYDKALLPLVAYFSDHYFRIFFANKKGKKRVDAILKKQAYFLYNRKTMDFHVSKYNNEVGYDYAGPLYTGDLNDRKILKRMLKTTKCLSDSRAHRLIQILVEESSVSGVGFYDLHRLVKLHKFKHIPKKELIVAEIKKAGYKVTDTHFSLLGIRSTMNVEQLTEIIANLSK